MEMSYHYLFDLALILLSTKIFGLITRGIKMPQVVGALIAGLVLGPAVFNILQETNFINQMAELGVIILMFSAGLETDIKELKKTGKASFVIALAGVIVPLLGGLGVAAIFNKGDTALTSSVFMQNIFIGVILTATSVSITVETLKELGKLNTRVGNAILGAALIDDILGIIALTLITSMADSTVSIWWVLAKILLFFVLAGIVGFLVYFAFNHWVEKAGKDLRRFIIIAFVLCLLMAYAAEKYFGVADITGAFIAGLIISNSQRTKYIASRFETMSYMLLSPIYFASIGIKVVIGNGMSKEIILFTVLITIVAVLTKIIGCGFGARMCRFSGKESVQIGTGMISRGEVALIVASKGQSAGLMGTLFFPPIVIMVVFTTVVTPILLKLVFKHDKTVQPPVDSELIRGYNELEMMTRGNCQTK
jgi:Kef-type K+ transport system membrane component KefB